MGHIRKRGRTWCAVVDIGRDDNGKRRQKWYSGFATKKAAQQKLVEVSHEINTSYYVEPTRIKVGEYLDNWLNDAAQNVAPQTHQRYEGIVRHHLKPALGGLPLSKLQPLHIQRYYAEALKSGRVGSKGSLSPTTVLQHHHVLSKALTDAMRLGLIPRNPAQAARPPRKAAHEVNYYDVEEVQALLTAVSESWLRIPVLIAVTTGMRRGEILGLKWSDVTIDLDADKGHVQVRRSLQETRDGVTTKAPKTASGSRSIPLPSTMVVALRIHRARQAERRLSTGSSYCNDDWVCAHDDGTVITPSAFSHGFTRLVAKAHLKPARLHDLRHTHATLLMMNGENAKVVSERLGHSSVHITLDVYSHVMPSMQQEAAQRFDTLLSSKASHSASA